MIAGIDEMLSKGISFSLYMTHGGTNWGHWAGANSPGFAPDVTSYDYDAPIDESGRVTPKYTALRNTLARYNNGKPLPKVPSMAATGEVAQFTLTEVAPLFANMPQPKTDRDIRTMEEYDQGFGSIVYTTILPKFSEPAILSMDAHDFTQVFINGNYIGKLDRRNGEKSLRLPACPDGGELTILVEAMGRINFGRAIKDFKGIVGKVELTIDHDGRPFVCDLKDWKVCNIEDELSTYTSMQFVPLSTVSADENGRLPRGAYRGTFNVRKPADTFLDFQTWGKGLVYVNGHPMGRIWEIGPQQTLYMPGCWLKKGENEIVVFDIVGPRETTVRGLREPLLDQLQVQKPLTHRLEGENLNLSGLTPLLSGEFAKANGWQNVKLPAAASGRYLCIEAVDGYDGDNAAIAEFYVVNDKGERISREPWIVDYADSEDVSRLNCSADKLFDLQESTYWKTAKGAPYPHAVVLDLGADHNVSEIQYLPRMESEVPGAIRHFRIYLSPTPFRK